MSGEKSLIKIKNDLVEAINRALPNLSLDDMRDLDNALEEAIFALGATMDATARRAFDDGYAKGVNAEHNRVLSWLEER